MATVLRAGAAAVTITPPLGISVFGAFHDERAQRVLSDLYARALVLDDGETAVAIIAVDLAGVGGEVADRIRERVESLTGIPAARVMLTCTHTHTGPAALGLPWYQPDPAYLDVLERRIADAAALAAGRLTEARLAVGRGAEPSLVFNRRFWMVDGTLRTNPPYQDPGIVRTAGPIDPEVGVVRCEATDGTAIAILVNYALHPAIVGGLDFLDGVVFSADFPGVLADTLERVAGEDAVVLFVNGCAGDINHRDRSKPGPQAGQAVADRIGRVLAAEVLKVSTGLEEIDGEAKLRFRRAMLELPLRVPSADELHWAQPYERAEMYEMDERGMEIVAAQRMLWVDRLGKRSLPVEIQVFTVGPLAYVTLPGEIFAALGLALKRRSPYPYTLVGAYNGSAGTGYANYIPTRAAYDEGGYEATFSLVAPGSGEAIVDEAVKLLTAAGE